MTRKRFRKTTLDTGMTLNVHTTLGMVTLDMMPFDSAVGCLIVPEGYTLRNLNGGPLYVIVPKE